MGKSLDDWKRINIKNLGIEVTNGIENYKFQKDLILELLQQISEKKFYRYLAEWKQDEYPQILLELHLTSFQGSTDSENLTVRCPRSPDSIIKRINKLLKIVADFYWPW